MSYASATGAQRLAVNTAATKLEKATLAARQGLNPSGVTNDAPVDTLAADMATALAAIGASAALPATQAIVSNGGTSPVQNSAGAAIGTGTYAVAANAVTNIKLPATVAGVTNGAKVNAGTVTGTGNFATFTVANGVITGITLSAS